MIAKFLFVVISLSIAIFFSNCSPKLAKEENKKETIVEDGFVIGSITNEYKDKACDYLIKVNDNGKEKIYAAINLSDELKKEGVKFKFKFKPIKAPRKGECKTGIFIYIIKYEIL